MAVRVVLPDGETLFTFATSAVSNRGYVGVFAWNAQTNSLDEIATFRKDAIVRVEVTKGGSLVETIEGHALARDGTQPTG
jgi:hypothetical protein